MLDILENPSKVELGFSRNSNFIFPAGVVTVNNNNNNNNNNPHPQPKSATFCSHIKHTQTAYHHVTSLTSRGQGHVQSLIDLKGPYRYVLLCPDINDL